MAKVRSSSTTRPHGVGLFNRSAPLSTHYQHETSRLIDELRHAIARAHYGTSNAHQHLAQQLVSSALGAQPIPTTLRQAYSDCATQLVRHELTSLYALPTPTTGTNPLTDHDTRNAVRAQLAYLQNEGAAIATWQTALRLALSTIARALPASPPATGSLTITVPLIGMLADPVGLIDDLVRRLSKLAPDPNTAEKQPGQRVAHIIIANLLTASRLTYDDAHKRPHRLVWPADAKLAPAELVTTYLANTPFATLLDTPVQRTIPDETLVSGVAVFGLPGSGKTQWLQSQVLHYLNRPDQPGILVMDSQGDCLKVLARLKRFDPATSDRLIIIDPTDTHPPACNIFGFDRAYVATLSDAHREEFLAGIIEMFSFIAGGLFGSALTPRMSLVFRYLATWLVQIPGANIHTLIEMLRDPTPFLHHADRLPPTARAFIDELYRRNSEYARTRTLIQERLYHVISSPAFERMFGHTENQFDMRSALNAGKCVLINTAKAQLHEGSPVFGRFWVAQLLQTAMARAFIPQHQRRLAVALIDECHEYTDANVTTLLLQARKYRVSVNLITQQTDNFKEPAVLKAIVGIPALRFTGALTSADATLLAREMNTTPEFLKSVRKTDRYAEWAVFARDITPTATKIRMPFLLAEREPKMTEAAYQRLLERNRQRVGAPRRPPAPNNTTQPPRFSNDPDTY